MIIGQTFGAGFAENPIDVKWIDLEEREIRRKNI